MKFLHTQLARSVWLFDLREINPGGKHLVREMIPWIAERYSFSEFPNPEQPTRTLANQAGLAFKNGSVQIDESCVSINNLAIYDDGIVIEAAFSTDHADSLAIDLLEGANAAFGLSFETDLVSKKMYVSELIVQSNVDFSALNAGLSGFASEMSQHLSHRGTFEVGGVSFWTKPDDAGKHAIVRIERQAGQPFAKKRYYSHAPMQTQAHIALLEEFEKSISQ